MNWQSLLDPDIQNFIIQHENADVARLALQKPPSPDWDYPAILNQIKSRQKAKTKIPQWLGVSGVFFPPPDIMEQASSAATAIYKASLVEAESFVDLTGGAGVDAAACAKTTDTGIIIEHNPQAAALLTHNMKALGHAHVKVLNQNAEDFISTMPETDLVLIDPERRDTSRKGKFLLEDCSPDILKLLPKLLKKAKVIVIKTSPMLDITQAINTLGAVHEVHILEYQGDCKELVFILKEKPNPDPLIHAVSLSESGSVLAKLSFTQQQEKSAPTKLSAPQRYLYEPGPAFQKSGGFDMMTEIYPVHKLHPQTHLYTSENLVENFPGRIFEIIAQYPVKSEKIPLKKANITIRNFPMSTQDLRKKLKIEDGGQDYLFACTLMQNEKIILHTMKLKFA